MKDLLQKKRTSGFTIIEVMIVLAIAGLIMVIVFIAVPQLQRNQRDNARQNIANRIKAEMETYAGNNQGQYPFDTATCAAAGSNAGKWCDFISRYISTANVNVKDPSTGNDVVTATAGAPKPWLSGTDPAPPAAKGDVVVAYGAKCSGETLVKSGNSSVNSRNYAIMIGLDRAGTVHCVDNG
jgi:prepilin-type N-terminal cleavage/methylation domain-containing protein